MDFDSKLLLNHDHSVSQRVRCPFSKCFLAQNEFFDFVGVPVLPLPLSSEVADLVATLPPVTNNCELRGYLDSSYFEDSLVCLQRRLTFLRDRAIPEPNHVRPGLVTVVVVEFRTTFLPCLLGFLRILGCVQLGQIFQNWSHFLVQFSSFGVTCS